MGKDQKILIEWELLLSMIGYLKMTENIVNNSNDNTLIVTYNDVYKRINDKLVAMKTREMYQKYQSAKMNDDELEANKCLKEYQKMKKQI